MKEINRAGERQTPFSKRLIRACRGLNYISETDAEVQPFFGEEIHGGLDRFTMLEALGLNHDTPIRQASPDDFFARLTAEKSWHTIEERRSRKRFARLQELLERELKDLTVFRIGEVQVDIFIVGIDAEDRLAGAKTRAVET